MKLTSEDWNKTYSSGVEYTPASEENVDKIVSYLPTDQGGIAIDLGSGTGQLARELQTRGFSVTGLDLSYEAVKKARNQSDPIDIHYEVADFETDLSPKFDQADLITTKYVYAFIENRGNFLQNVKNLLKANGCFILINPLKSEVPEYKKYISLDTQQIVEELEKYFELVDYYIDNGVEYFICKLTS